MKRIFYILLVAASLMQAKEIYATFDVTAQQQSDLAFSMQGVVKEVFVQIGDRIKKGQILATLNNDELKSSVEASKIVLKYAKKDYDRQAKVKEIINQVQFDSFALQYESAKSQLKYQQALLQMSILRAPYDALIVDKNIEVGDMAGAQINGVFSVQSLGDVKLVLKFDSQHWKDVQKGNKFLYSLSGDDTLYEGVISIIYPSVNPQTRMLQAEVLIKHIPTGLFGSGTIVTE